MRGSRVPSCSRTQAHGNSPELHRSAMEEKSMDQATAISKLTLEKIPRIKLLEGAKPVASTPQIKILIRLQGYKDL